MTTAWSDRPVHVSPVLHATGDDDLGWLVVDAIEQVADPGVSTSWFW